MICVVFRGVWIFDVCASSVMKVLVVWLLGKIDCILRMVDFYGFMMFVVGGL